MGYRERYRETGTMQRVRHSRTIVERGRASDPRSQLCPVAIDLDDFERCRRSTAVDWERLIFSVPLNRHKGTANRDTVLDPVALRGHKETSGGQGVGAVLRTRSEDRSTVGQIVAQYRRTKSRDNLDRCVGCL